MNPHPSICDEFPKFLEACGVPSAEVPGWTRPVSGHLAAMEEDWRRRLPLEDLLACATLAWEPGKGVPGAVPVLAAFRGVTLGNSRKYNGVVTGVHSVGANVWKPRDRTRCRNVGLELLVAFCEAHERPSGEALRMYLQGLETVMDEARLGAFLSRTSFVREPDPLRLLSMRESAGMEILSGTRTLEGHFDLIRFLVRHPLLRDVRTFVDAPPFSLASEVILASACFSGRAEGLLRGCPEVRSFLDDPAFLGSPSPHAPRENMAVSLAKLGWIPENRACLALPAPDEDAGSRWRGVKGRLLAHVAAEAVRPGHAVPPALSGEVLDWPFHAMGGKTDATLMDILAEQGALFPDRSLWDRPCGIHLARPLFEWMAEGLAALAEEGEGSLAPLREPAPEAFVRGVLVLGAEFEDEKRILRCIEGDLAKRDVSARSAFMALFERLGLKDRLAALRAARGMAVSAPDAGEERGWL